MNRQDRNIILFAVSLVTVFFVGFAGGWINRAHFENSPVNVNFTFNTTIPAKSVSEMTNAALDAMAKKGALPTFKEIKP